MSSSFTTDNLQALATFPFKDTQWQGKFLIGTLLIFAGYAIPIIPLIFVYGYVAQIMQRIIVEKGEPVLPEWDDWGRLFTDGLKITGVTLIYVLPALIFLCGGYGLFIGSSIFLGAASGNMENAEALPLFIPLVSMVTLFAGFGLGMIFMLLAGLIMPVAVGHLIATGDFGAAFRIQELWTIFQANLAGYLISYVLVLGIWMALSFALNLLYFTIIFCCLIPFIMPAITIYMMVVSSVLFAEAYRGGVDAQAVKPLPQSV